MLFSVTRDVFRSIRLIFSAVERAVREFHLPPERKPVRPVGMEFLTSADREYLIGREEEINEALGQLEQGTTTLMLGESGVGKTSLVHAGIIPAAARRAWRPVYVRPLGMPCSDIIEQAESSIFVGGTRRHPLLQTVAEILTALDGTPLLLVIDQFEDVLSTTFASELDDLVSGLSALRDLSSAGLHVLISYRSDLEGRLGTFWQRISGSPRGFPRVYVSGLKIETFWPGVVSFCGDLGIELQLSSDHIQQICADIVAISKEIAQSKVYPPYVQMLLDYIWHAQITEGARRFTFDMYESAGRAAGIVRRYLAQQLQYANDNTGELRLLLVSLVRSYGTKAQRSLEELAADTGIEVGRCEALLERLIDLRLVRHLSHLYEVSHDFLAKMILEELVDLEEREYKSFRELLSSRALAFTATSNRLTVEELLFLYKYRYRVTWSKPEAELIVDTWIYEDVPGLFWICKFDRSWIEEQLARYDHVKLDGENHYSFVFLKNIFGLPLRDQDFLALTRTYKIASEAAQMIRSYGRAMPKEVIWVGLRSRRSEIRDACFDAIVDDVNAGDISAIRSLRNRSGSILTATYLRLTINQHLLDTWGHREESRDIHEFAHLQAIARAPSVTDARRHLVALCKARPRKVAKLFANALLQIRRGKIDGVLSKIRKVNAITAIIYITALEIATGEENLSKTVRLYLTLNDLEKDRSTSPALSKKSREVARVIRKLSSAATIPLLRNALSQMRLLPSSRDVTASILENGRVEDVTAVLQKVAESKETTYYENQMEMCQSLMLHLSSSEERVPGLYLRLMSAENFWRFVPAKEQLARAVDMLPIRNYENRILFIRILAHAVSGLARSGDEEPLRKLINHSYITVSRPAAARLSSLIGDAVLGVLSSEIDQAVRSGRAKALAEALRFSEHVLYAGKR